MILKEVRSQIVSRDIRLKDPRIEVEIVNPAVLSAYEKKGSGTVAIKLDAPRGMRLAGSTVLPLSVYEKGVYKEKVYVQARIKIMNNVAVASDRIRRGQAFDESNTACQERETTFLPQSVVFDPSSIIGKESMTLIPQGTVILGWMARKVPDIKKGDHIRVLSIEGEVSASLAAQALEDAYIGQKIRVKSQASNKIIEATVISSTEAKIK
jgi:flagella basal body P-ring formation protein FlgA